MNRIFPIVSAVLAAALVGAGAAHAFTMEGGSDKTPGRGETSPFYDSKKSLDLDTSKDTNKLKFDNGTSIYFGQQQNSPEQDYRRGVDRMFNPLGRPGQ